MCARQVVAAELEHRRAADGTQLEPLFPFGLPQAELATLAAAAASSSCNGQTARVAGYFSGAP